MALQTKLNNNLSSIKALRINASDNANDAQKSIDNARKIAEESASKEIENLSNQLNKINFKDLSASIFDLQTEETNIQKAIDEINKTKDDGSGTMPTNQIFPLKKTRNWVVVNARQNEEDLEKTLKNQNVVLKTLITILFIN